MKVRFAQNLAVVAQIMFIYSPPNSVADPLDDWLITDESFIDSSQTSFGFGLEQDNHQSQSQNFSFNHQFNNELFMSLGHGLTEYNDTTDAKLSSSDASLGLSLNEQLTLTASLLDQGQRQALEWNGISFQLEYEVSQWIFGIGLEQGDIALFFKPEIITRFDLSSKVSTDFDSINGSVAYIAENFILQLAYQDYNYERNVGLFGSSLILQNSLKAEALSHSGLLLDFSQSLNLTLFNDESSVSFQVQKNKSAVDQQSIRSIQASYSWSVTDQILANCFVSTTDENHPNTSSGLSFEWQI